jgi:2-haloacid dehalogenase
VRAAAVVFDCYTTLFDLEPLRSRLTASGLSNRELEVWLSRIARDGIALCASGTYRPFGEVAASALAALGAEVGQRAYAERISEVVAGFADLPAYKDARPALTQLSEAGTRRAVLTDGTSSQASKLLAQADMAKLVEQVVSIDEVRRWKPFPEPYRRVAQALGLAPSSVAYFSAHPWDVQGAKAAGLYGVLLSRRGGHHQAAMPAPDLTIAALAELAQIGVAIDP